MRICMCGTTLWTTVLWHINTRTSTAPCVQESAAAVPSPSSAFLLDAVNVSGLANSGMPNYLRGNHQPEASLTTAEQSAWPDEDSLHSAVTGTGNPIPFPSDGLQAGQPSVPGSGAPSQAGAKTGAEDRVLSGTLPQQTDAAGPSERVSSGQKTFSRGPTTPRGAMDPPAAVPSEGDVPGGSPGPPSTRGGQSAAAGTLGAGAAGATSQGVAGAAAGGAAGGVAAKKKKASDMTKSERRALQEEQRAQKNAAKAPQGMSPTVTRCVS